MMTANDVIVEPYTYIGPGGIPQRRYLTRTLNPAEREALAIIDATGSARRASRNDPNRHTVSGRVAARLATAGVVEVVFIPGYGHVVHRVERI